MPASVARRRSAIVRTALALSCLAAPARAAPVEPGTCPPPGTVIVTSARATFTFQGRSGLVCSLTSSTDGRYQTFGLVTLVNSMNYQADKARIAQLWPLAVGKEVKFNVVRGSYAYIADYTVLGTTDITVKAGTFRTYVVRYEETQTSARIAASHTGIYHSIWTFWISPEVGFFVKVDYQSISGGPSAYYPHTPWEAVSISMPK